MSKTLGIVTFVALGLAVAGVADAALVVSYDPEKAWRLTSAMALPAPAAWALMIAVCGVTGAALRRFRAILAPQSI